MSKKYTEEEMYGATEMGITSVKCAIILVILLAVAALSSVTSFDTNFTAIIVLAVHEVILCVIYARKFNR